MDRGTVIDLLRRNAAEHPDILAIVDGDSRLTWGEYASGAGAVALALLDLGVRRGEVVGLHMVNRAEHVLSDLGALLAGAIPTSYYNTLTHDQLAYVAADSACRVAIVDADKLDTWLAIRDRLPRLRALVVVGGEAQGPVVSYEDIVARAARAYGDRWQEVGRTAARVRPEDTATIVYTSGTTGHPKGAVITHAGIRAALDGVVGRAVEDIGGHPAPGYAQISYLPLAHMAERTITHYLACRIASTVTYVRDIRELADALPAVRPQVFLAVPRVWEKLRSAVVSRAADRTLLRRAVVVATAAGRLGPLGRIEHALHRPFHRAIRARLGLDRMVIAVSGAAPIPPDVLAFFRGIGVPVVEAYGMTETSAVLTIDSLRSPTPGTVGRPLPGVELRIAADGEILAKGTTIVPGYHNRPDADAEAFDADGWLRTGDLGSLDADGRLRVTGRKKELIITAAGKNISPANVEQAIGSASDLIGSVYAHGDGKPYLVALLTLDATSWKPWCQARGVPARTTAEAAAHPAVLAEVARAVAAGNTRLSRVEQVKRWALLDRPWDGTTGELTPTLKLKRPVIREKYAADLAELHRSPRT
ncbi:AMP-dependent synthetase/ligase [Actinokineospora guangxiensis]|uniref:Acyl-CoA synthetase n=1 Tax=Actinokineospora guangxiensis TaxID=1490288 RepID=A0ABW0EQ68_9PSEU